MKTRLLVSTAILAATFLSIGSAPAQQPTPTPIVPLYSFCSAANCADGAIPQAGLIRDTAGNLYGTTFRGGASANNAGTVFKVDNTGHETVLYSFCSAANCKDGAGPQADLIQDAAGNLFGTTQGGGNGGGTVFKIDGAGHESVLHSFCAAANCTDGLLPFAGVTGDSAGNLYGTTIQGGANNRFNAFTVGGGAVFKIDSAGQESVVYSFCAAPNCTDGEHPVGRLIQDSAGSLYGATANGGANTSANNKFGGGTVFKIDSAGHETVLYSFCSLANCADGFLPLAGVTRDSAGNLYGTTEVGGTGSGSSGVVFKIDNMGHETVLYSFCSLASCADGAFPLAGVIQDATGNLYGTTTGGGANGGGTVFKLVPPPQPDSRWTLEVLYNFCSAANCADGSSPAAGVIQDATGNFYGTTAQGGANGVEGTGTVFKLRASCRVDVTRLGQCRIFDPLPYLLDLQSGDFAPWNPTPYAFHAASEGFTGSICDLGCALTSLSMSLLKNAPLLPDCPRNPTGSCQGAAIDQPNNPGSLNAFMNRGILLLDFGENNDVNWDVATRDVGIQLSPSGQIPKLRFDLSCFRLRSDSINERPGCGTATDYLDKHLCAGQPVIVRVTGSDGLFGHHKVLVIAKSGSDYLINDPANPAGLPAPRHTFLSQYGLFDIVGVVVDPVGDMSGLNISVGTNADLLVTDQSGQRTGANPDGGDDLLEIPQSAHVVDATDDEVTGSLPTSSIHLVNLFQPTSGKYHITVIGSHEGLYTLSIQAYSSDGQGESAIVVSGISAPGSLSTFVAPFSSTPGSVPHVVRTATFQSTLDDIANSERLGFIKARRAHSLSRFIRRAQDEVLEGENHEARHLLEEFEEQVREGRRHIANIAADILLEDANSLISQIPKPTDNDK